MERHLRDEDLILHFYGEGRVEDESGVDAHLESCAACRALWQEIADTLKLVDTARVPEPDEQFEEAIWNRIRAALPLSSADSPKAAAGQRLGRPLVQWILPAAGLAAAVLLAVFVGHGWRSARVALPPPSEPRAAVDPAGRERVLLTALGDHFQRSEMLLVEVMNAGTTGEELEFDRQTADDLLDSSRLYRVAAEHNGKERLAGMLEALESVLVEIARSPDQVDRSEVRSLRARIENDDLLFKVRAVSKEIQERQQSLWTE